MDSKIIPAKELKSTIKSLNRFLKNIGRDTKIVIVGVKKEYVVENFTIIVSDLIDSEFSDKIPRNVINFYNKYIIGKGLEKKYRVISPDMEEKIIDWYNHKDIPIREMADCLGVSYKTVYSRIDSLRKQGKIPKERNTNRNNSKPETEIKRETLSDVLHKKQMQESRRNLDSDISSVLDLKGSEFSSIMNDIMDVAESNAEISTRHKEMLIEILHKLIC